MDNKKKNEKTGIDLRRIAVPVLMAVLAILLIVAMAVFRDDENGGMPSSDPAPKSVTVYDYFNTVGVIYSFVGDSDTEFRSNALIAENVLREYHELFDIYNDHENVTGLYEINKNAGVAPVEVPLTLIDFLDFCIEMYEITDGEVNIAMGAVLRLWHECRADAAYDPENAKLPDREALEEAARHCSISDIVIDRERSTVFLRDPEMSLDVGAVGKGYAVERAAESLKSHGVTGYALDIGGNVRIIGEKPSGAPFRTGIKDPIGAAENGYAEILELKNTSAVTSGGYERGYEVDGVRYHHIIDKDTLISPEYFASVTVVTEDSGLADALSTALFCMERESGEALISSIEGVEVVWVYADGTVVKSE